MELYVSNSVRESVNGSSLSEMEDAVYHVFPCGGNKIFQGGPRWREQRICSTGKYGNKAAKHGVLELAKGQSAVVGTLCLLAEPAPHGPKWTKATVYMLERTKGGIWHLVL